MFSSLFSSRPIAFLAFSSVFLCFYSADDAEGRVVLPDFHNNKQFSNCCKSLRVFSQKAIVSMCHYPPSHGEIPPVDVREEISANLDAYIGCYAAHQNNTQCCYDNGVKGEYFDACRDFCCGGPEPCPRHKSPQRVYYACVSKVKQIAECNKAAWDNLAGQILSVGVNGNSSAKGEE